MEVRGVRSQPRCGGTGISGLDLWQTGHALNITKTRSLQRQGPAINKLGLMEMPAGLFSTDGLLTVY